jgi:hypothetical protein
MKVARLAWLLLRRDRQGRLALGIATSAIGVAVLLLLVVVHFPQAMSNRGQRLGWRSGFALEIVDPSQAEAWWAMPVTGDRYRGEPIGRLDVAAVDPEAPPPPGLPRQPRPGEVWLSPALRSLVERVPDNQLRDRFPGTIAGEIGPEGLTHPSEMVAVVGRTVTEAHQLGAVPVAAPYATAQRVVGRLLPVASTLAAVAVIAPLVMLIASATRLQAAARDQRLAALRLVGATPAQVAALVVAVAAAIAAVGTVLGLAGFLALRPLLATTGVTGVRFFPDDFALSALGWMVVALAPVLAVGGASLGLARLNVSPLEVARKAVPDRPHPRRLWLLIGAVLLFAVVLGMVFSGSLGEGLALLVIGASFGLIIVGVVAAGPWVTEALGRLLTRVAKGPETLIAGRRISHGATSNYRLAIGIVLVALAGGVFYALLPALEAEAAQGTSAGLRPDVLMAVLPRLEEDRGPAIQKALQGTLGVKTVVENGEAGVPAEDGSSLTLLVTLGECQDLSSVLQLGDLRCADSWVAVADDVAIPAESQPLIVYTPEGFFQTTLPQIPPDASRFHVDRLEYNADLLVDPDALNLPDGIRARIDELYISYDGGPETAERIRTLVISELSTAQVFTAEEARQAALAPLRQARGPVSAALIATLAIGGVSAAISAVGSLLERHRQLVQMRIVGVPVRSLRRQFVFETVAPLGIIATTATGVGLGLAWLLLEVGDYYTPTLLRPKDALILATGIVTALIVAAAPSRTLDQRTRYDTIRTE